VKRASHNKGGVAVTGRTDVGFYDEMLYRASGKKAKKD
jgi:hypothetical protein